MCGGIRDGFAIYEGVHDRPKRGQGEREHDLAAIFGVYQ